jgi:alanine racemase
MYYTSVIEINKSALLHNLQFLRGLVGQDIRISSVVKGNAYGHGIEQFVPVAEECGVDHFSVFSADEALRLSKVSNGESTIMIMGMIDNQEIEWAIAGGIEFYVFELDRLEKALEVSKKLGLPAKIHVEIETGMNRTGFEEKELPRVREMLKQHPTFLNFEGLCTHYAGAESIGNYYRIMGQRKKYSKILKRFKNEGLEPKFRHTACSAAALRYPTTRMDLVRFGILQYGFFPSRETMVEYISKEEEMEYPLKRLISWKSKVMSLKHVKTGEFIGYGISYLANTDMTVASVPVGYYHGYSRRLSNRGRVLIHGARVGVVGMVNMNMMLVDVSNLENVRKGDEVVLIGEQDDQEISVSSFGEFSVQLNYELLTRLPQNIPRRVVEK